MYTASQCDVFLAGEKTFEQMCEESTYDHFWVVGDDVTIIHELMGIQRNLPVEPRLFRDSVTNTVAGALLNRQLPSTNFIGPSFSDSTFKGSYITRIRTQYVLDIVTVGENKSLDPDLPNRVIVIQDESELNQLVKREELTEYFFFVEKNFSISDYFSFEANYTNVIDCHYSYHGEYKGKVDTDHSIKLLNTRRIKQVPTHTFLKYDGYLPLQYFSGTKVD